MIHLCRASTLSSTKPNSAHGHLCAGQILGVRLAMLGCERLGIDDPNGLVNPKDRKRLVTFIEIDRWRHRRHRRRHWLPPRQTGHELPGLGQNGRHLRRSGFSDDTRPCVAMPPEGSTPIYKGIRIAALESSKQRARDLYPHNENKHRQQMLAYRELQNEELFSEKWVAVPLHPREMPGYKSARICCEICSEGINYDRGVHREGKILCEACASPETRYYQPLPQR